MSPTQRSLALMRDLGYTAQVVEHWNPFAHVRQDLFGFGDVIAFCGGHITLIQTTSGSNVAARREKIEAEPKALGWLKAGGKIEIHGWAKRGAKGKAKRWTCRRVIGAPMGIGIVWIEGETGDSVSLDAEAGP